ncbi:MAG: hypothetical protein ABJA35_16145 [Parafilimonas sp.]
MEKRKGLWITLTLANLCIVAFFGTMLRTAFVFSVSWIDYRSFLSAHSHFAFGGWVTLALFMLLVYEVLPENYRNKKIYQWLLAGIEITSLGMAATFPFEGYAALSIFFSTLFLVVAYIFCWIFIKDLFKANVHKTVRLLACFALIYFVISTIGPALISYILIANFYNSLLYKNALYIYLHFQYNGFFTLSVFALFFNRLIPYATDKTKKIIRQFSVLLCCSVVPSVFMSLFTKSYQNLYWYISLVGCALIILSLVLFFRMLFSEKKIFIHPPASFAKTLWNFSMIAFVIKMILQAGTIIPQLAKIVFGDRPAIIGFLHLVFLGFVTFFILSIYCSLKAFNTKKFITKFALVFFSSAILLNEIVLLFQGVGILFETTSHIYPWLLWSAAICLFTGAILLITSRLNNIRSN